MLAVHFVLAFLFYFCSKHEMPGTVPTRNQMVGAAEGVTRANSENTRSMPRQGHTYAIGILGDLHLEPSQMHLFREARDQARLPFSCKYRFLVAECSFVTSFTDTDKGSQ
jgi:hypothetical protein